MHRVPADNRDVLFVLNDGSFIFIIQLVDIGIRDESLEKPPSNRPTLGQVIALKLAQTAYIAIYGGKGVFFIT